MIPASCCQPRVATRSPRASIPATIRSPNAATIARAASGSSIRIVPSTTDAAPASMRACTSAGVRTPPPVCTGTSTAAQIARNAACVLARTERAVEIDDVQRARAGGDERAGARDRIVVVLRFARGVAALEAHASAAAQIDRRDEQQRRASGARAPGNCRAARPPVRWLFSGWNCVAITLSRATIAAKRPP